MRYTSAVCCMALLLSGCSRKEQVAQTASEAPHTAPSEPGVVNLPPDSPKLKQIRVAPVQLAEVPTDEVDAPGKIELNPNLVSHVSLPVAGRVSSVLVHIGDFVKKGQTLLTLESPDVDQAQSATLQAEAGVNQAKANLLKAQADLDRVKDLAEHKAIAQKEVLNAENAVAQAKSSLEQAQAAKTQAVRRLELFGLKPGQFGEKLSVNAPISGKVLDMTVVPGEYRNDTTGQVMTIADLSTVWVSSDVPESSIRFIQLGERLEINLAAYPGETFIGRVKRIADTVDPQTRTVKVRAELNNDRGRLRPEMFGRIRHVESMRKGVVVPAGAVIQGEGENLVYVERAPGKFAAVPVKLGTKVEDGFAVLSGLREGDRVVVDGAMLLKGA